MATPGAFRSSHMVIAGSCEPPAVVLLGSVYRLSVVIPMLRNTKRLTSSRKIKLTIAVLRQNAPDTKPGRAYG